MQNLFHAINELFWPNTKDNTAQEEKIYLKNIRKGDAAWSMQRAVLGWEIDTVKQVFTLPEDRKINLLALINTIPLSTSQ